MNKLKVIGLSFLVVILLGLLGRLIFPQVFLLSVFEQGNITENKESYGKRDLKAETMTNVNEEFPEDMSEHEVQHAIHMMSHQKVKADEKWGAMLITENRINRLIEVVEINGSEYDQSSLYLDILNGWKEGNFSRVDREHNEIWEIQGGTIGKATGILTPAQELEFIEKNFK